MGCDQGEPHDSVPSPPPPPVHFVSSNVGPDRAAPADGTLDFTFDRLLLPVTVTRQSVTLRQTGVDTLPSPVVIYDPVSRTVSLSSPDPFRAMWLVPGQEYSVTLGSSGLRAFDGAPLANPTVVSFDVTEPVGWVRPSRVAFCVEVLPLLQARCGTCHGSAPTPAGLVLTTSAGVLGALSRVASGANTGPMGGGASAPGVVFGVDMALIDPGGPGTSWLMYKLLLGARESGTLSDDERSRLGELVLGDGMRSEAHV